MQRPAAVEQLKVLGEQLGVPVFNVAGRDAARHLQAGARAGARRGKNDVVVYDTAGRLAIDEPLMEELARHQGRRRSPRTSSSSSTR